MNLFCSTIAFAGLAVASPAQTLSLSSVSPSADRIAAIQFSIQSPPGKEPVAMQWEMTYPAAQLTVAPRSPYAGKAAQDSGKSIKCAGAWKKPARIYAQKCILAGGLEPLHNGVIATLEFTVAGDVAPGSSLRIQVSADAVTRANRKTRLGEAHGVIRVGS